MSESLPLGFMMERATRMIKLRFHQLFKEHGVDLTPEQWVIIDILKREGVLSQKQLAELSFKDAPSISRLLDGLIQKGLIDKTSDKIDKRATNICLTRKGDALVDKVRPLVIELRRLGLVGLDADQTRRFSETLEHIFQNYMSPDN